MMTKATEAARRLRGRYVEGLPAKRKVVDEALEALRSGSLPSDEVEATLRRLAHQIRGSAASFGFTQIGDAAHDLEYAKDHAEALSAAEALAAALRQVHEAESSSGKRVLLIDDNPAIGLIINALMAEENIIMTQVMTASAATDELSSREWDLIFVDLVLPDADGRSLLTQIRKHRKHRDTPLIVLSAKTGSLVKNECLTYGIDAFVEKPIDPATFAVGVTSVLARSLALQAAAYDDDELSGQLDPLGSLGSLGSLDSLDSGRDFEPSQTLAARDAQPLTSTDSRPTILVAEDDRSLAAMLLHDLAEDFEVTHAADGDAAIEAALRVHFDLMLLDYQMPGRNGVEVVRALRQRQQYAQTPILLLTALGSDAAIEAAFAAGADDYIAKPYSRRSLLARLTRHLGRSPSQSMSGGRIEADIEETTVTALFCDISGFTEMAASMTPRAVVAVLNSYFPIISDIVFRHDGTLEKYIGDAVLAVWGAPLRHEDDALRALRAAVEIQQAITDLEQQTARPLRVHIGLNSGPVAAANIGSKHFLQYATIGDATNLASRVCDIAAPGEIALGTSTVEMLGGSSPWPLEGPQRFQVKGRTQPISVYKLRWDADSS